MGAEGSATRPRLSRDGGVNGIVRNGVLISGMLGTVMSGECRDLLLRVVPAALVDLEGVIANGEDEPMLAVNPHTPPSGQVASKRLGFSGGLVAVALDVPYQSVDAAKRPLVSGLPR